MSIEDYINEIDKKNKANGGGDKYQKGTASQPLFGVNNIVYSNK